MRIDVTQQDEIAIARVTGEVDLADGFRFTDEVLGKMADEATALVVDLMELRYIDSAGVRSIFEIASALALREQFFAIAVAEESPLRSVLKMTQVEDVAVICPSLDDALQLVTVTLR
jgi:stage II sporulation protein AA (anti-sigma F factor antagonist)